MTKWWHVEPIGWSEAAGSVRGTPWEPCSVLAATAEVAAVRWAEDAWSGRPPPTRVVVGVREEVGTSGRLVEAPAATFELVPRTAWNARRVG